MSSLFGLAAVLFLLGIAYAVALQGKSGARKYTRWTSRQARKGTEGIGRGMGRFAMRNPFIVGVIVLLLLFYSCSR